MNIIQNLVPESKYSLKCPYEMMPEFIVVHNTANDATARNEIAYMVRNSSSTSYHYAVDDKEIVQGLPENRNGWHAGDGRYGDGNRKGIGIEICYSESGGDRFIAAEKLTAKFIASKLNEKGWGIDKVKKHQDFQKKYCPHRTLDMGWQRFLDMIQAELNNIKPANSETKNEEVFEMKLNTIKKGSTGGQVTAMQAMLIGFGYDLGKYGADGDFGQITETALKKYQSEHKLQADGVCGPSTWTSLFSNDNAEPEKEWVPDVGDIVNFKGDTHYGNPSAATGRSAAAGQAKITKVANGKHPYHLVRTGKTGPYGWVDAGTFTKV